MCVALFAPVCAAGIPTSSHQTLNINKLEPHLKNSRAFSSESPHPESHHPSVVWPTFVWNQVREGGREGILLWANAISLHSYLAIKNQVSHATVRQARESIEEHGFVVLPKLLKGEALEQMAANMVNRSDTILGDLRAAGYEMEVGSKSG